MKASADAAVMAMRTDRESLIRAVLSTVIASAVSGSGVHDSSASSSSDPARSFAAVSLSA